MFILGILQTEYPIRCPKNGNKRLQVMRFASERDLDFKKWTNVKMERENNMREFKGMEEDQPKFGAGSEFGCEFIKVHMFGS
jgi:transcription initiation factor TFIIF subunit alpha